MGALLRLFGLILFAMAVLSVVTWLWGDDLLRVFFGAAFVLPPAVLVPLVASSGFVGALCVTGPALLARARHSAYALGWLGATAVAVGMLFVPLPLEVRCSLALSVGPAVGIAIHLIALADRKPASASGTPHL
jgi:hypothetical protein